eukprot:TRINITY_DN27631_c0_g1_i2.p1 TRINITY_DN27631_c0_g1~~TRINITY_DN27631_c0_g1_i2.p1  ORF type:complete len:304 (-),score=31.28 TRINITY_DN27631_c0_g1_i2:302-1213(-)
MCTQETAKLLFDGSSSLRHQTKTQNPIFEISDLLSVENLQNLVRRKNQAKRLNASLKTIGIKDWREKLINSTILTHLGGVLATVSAMVRPVGPGGCDHNALERSANLITSIPFFVVGSNMIQNRKTSVGKAFGATICGVGMSSLSFHGSTGCCRPMCRKFDYWMIALSSLCLAKASIPELPNRFVLSSILMTPFQPFAVSVMSSALSELEFWKRAYKDENLRPAHVAHTASVVAGMGCFYLEDVCPKIPLVHSLWHCLATSGLQTTNALMQHVETERGLNTNYVNVSYCDKGFRVAQTDKLLV